MELISWDYLYKNIGDKVTWKKYYGIVFPNIVGFPCKIPIKFNNEVVGVYISAFEMFIVPESQYEKFLNEISSMKEEKLTFDTWKLEQLEKIPSEDSSKFSYTNNEFNRYSFCYGSSSISQVESGRYRLTSSGFDETFEIIHKQRYSFYTSTYIGHRLSKDCYACMNDRLYYFSLFQFNLENNYVIRGNN